MQLNIHMYNKVGQYSDIVNAKIKKKNVTNTNKGGNI